MKRIRVARSATADLDEIWIYVARRDGADAATVPIFRRDCGASRLAGTGFITA